MCYNVSLYKKVEGVWKGGRGNLYKPMGLNGRMGGIVGGGGGGRRVRWWRRWHLIVDNLI